MLTPGEIQRLAERKYPVFLRSLVTKESIFPLRVRFGKPNTGDDFATLKTDVTHLADGNFGYSIEWEERKTRRWGLQKLPCQVRFDSEEQFVGALGKQKEVARFKDNLAFTLARLPPLRGWLVSHSKSVAEFETIWESLVTVCEYFLANPTPGLYLRQLPIPVHTKFVEENRKVLSSMLEAILPESSRTGGIAFEEKFGLRQCDSLIRFRLLDPKLLSKLGVSHDDMGLPVSVMRKLSLSGLRVIITENLMNFLCLPAMENTLAIFGHGNAAELLTRIDWLRNCEALYWGDIDEHGFHILARLRSRFLNIRSLMMDISTLEKFNTLTGPGERAGKPPINLTDDERAAYEFVAINGRRLEQEKIPQSCVVNTLIRECSPQNQGRSQGPALYMDGISLPS